MHSGTDVHASRQMRISQCGWVAFGLQLFEAREEIEDAAGDPRALQHVRIAANPPFARAFVHSCSRELVCTQMYAHVHVC